MIDMSSTIPTPANDNARDYPTATTALDSLYELRRAVLTKRNLAAMTLKQRRLLPEMMKRFEKFEAELLRKLRLRP